MDEGKGNGRTTPSGSGSRRQHGQHQHQYQHQHHNQAHGHPYPPRVQKGASRADKDGGHEKDKGKGRAKDGEREKEKEKEKGKGREKDRRGSKEPDTRRVELDDPVRRHLREVAKTTIDAINLGYVDEPIPGTNDIIRHPIRDQVLRTQTYTHLYNADDERLRAWRIPPPKPLPLPNAVDNGVLGEILQMSTTEGARYLHQVDPVTSIGILNFASATKPGGGFLNGARAQEESIARASSLYASLVTENARPFYTSHGRDEKGGFYTHAMIYSPQVQIFRDDNAVWHTPIKVDVVTSPAVNAGKVRRYTRRPPDELEGRIREVMFERMGRILAVFERNNAKNLVLGSFGTGVFQNDVKSMASLWRELLNTPNARFGRSFERVVFAIPDPRTIEKFKEGFLDLPPRGFHL